MCMKPFIWLPIPPIMFADYTSCVSVYSVVGTMLLLAYLEKYLFSILFYSKVYLNKGSLQKKSVDFFHTFFTLLFLLQFPPENDLPTYKKLKVLESGKRYSYFRWEYLEDI